MKYIFKLKLLFNIKQFKYIFIGALILLSTDTAWSQHQCTGECYVEPDYTTTLTTKLPYAEIETEVTVGVKDGIAYYEGDIMLGKLSDLQQKGVARDNGYWTNSTIPYTIGAGFTATEISKINSAAASITANTNLCVVPRNGEANYVNFNPSDVCNSWVGMIGGEQTINLASGCGFGSTIHELLHAAGIWHEQSREDRDSHVTINWANIESGKEHNFNQHITGSSDYGSYDYGSLMHYGAYAFSDNGLPTITTIPSGIPIGQRTALSAGDIATVNAIYPNPCGGPCPANATVTTTYNSGSNIDIEVSNTITALNIINSGANVDYDAGNLVRLTTGFHAKNGSTFHAFNDGCGGAMIVSEENEDVSGTEAYALESNIEAISDFTLRNYPNPFTGQTTIEYKLPNDSPVTLIITDVAGKQISVLINNETKPQGTHTAIFNGSNYPAGMYYYTIQAGNYLETQKMTLVK